jgi:hypothetical protein
MVLAILRFGHCILSPFLTNAYDAPIAAHWATIAFLNFHSSVTRRRTHGTALSYADILKIPLP